MLQFSVYNTNERNITYEGLVYLVGIMVVKFGRTTRPHRKPIIYDNINKNSRGWQFVVHIRMSCVEGIKSVADAAMAKVYAQKLTKCVKNWQAGID